MIRLLLGLGYSEAQVRLMVRDNPVRLVGQEVATDAG